MSEIRRKYIGNGQMKRKSNYVRWREGWVCWGREGGDVSVRLMWKQRPRQREEQVRALVLKHILATTVDPCGKSTGMEGGSSS